jgi:hypothetical protein
MQGAIAEETDEIRGLKQAEFYALRLVFFGASRILSLYLRHQHQENHGIHT